MRALHAFTQRPAVIRGNAIPSRVASS